MSIQSIIAGVGLAGVLSSASPVIAEPSLLNLAPTSYVIKHDKHKYIAGLEVLSFKLVPNKKAKTSYGLELTLVIEI